jgi:hypothetical protein
VFRSDQATVTDGHLRYEDVTQDGRLVPLALPPALGGLWRGVLRQHPGAKNAQATGIIPILTRLTIESVEQAVRVDKPIESRSGFELARDGDPVSRLFMNVWTEVHGAAGKIGLVRKPGELALAGSLFAEHTFTRLFAPPDQRRVTQLAVEGYPTVPEAVYVAPAPATAGDAPAGARWLGELAVDPVDACFTIDQTDSNQHVNSLVYIRVFLDAAQRRLAETAQSLRVRSRAVDIAYRKPCFVGDKVRAHVRLFELDGAIGAAGFIATDDAKPRCYVRVLFGP